jgi:AcrR family transcriptional regulator
MACVGRPRTFDRDEALRKAMHVFWEKGYEGTTMANLIEAIGMKAPSVYAAFGNKDSLFKEAVSLYTGIVENGPLKSLKEETDIMQALKQLFAETIKLYTCKQNPTSCLIMTAAINCAPEHHDHVETLKHLRSHYKAAFKIRFDQALTEQQLKSDANPDALAEFYATLIQGLAIRARDGATKAELEHTCELGLAALQSALK